MRIDLPVVLAVLSTLVGTSLASDGLAALVVLKIDPRIDLDRFGVWGVSQGG